MNENKSKTETKSSGEGQVNQKESDIKDNTPLWDIRFGEWAPLDSNTDLNLSSYSALLSKEDSLFIIREFKLCNDETDGNRYLIKNKSANNLFYGIERSVCCDKFCICGANRAFDLTFYDRNKEPALRLYRPLRINCCGLIPCCRQKIEVKDKSDKSIGEVIQKFNLFRFAIKLKSKQTEVQLYGPTCEATLSYCLDDLCFNIYDKSDIAANYKTSCGHICKLSEFSCGGHIFRVKFGKDWTPELKSIVIGATILIDYNFFENSYHESKYHRLSLPSAPQTLPPFPQVIRYREVDPKTE